MKADRADAEQIREVFAENLIYYMKINDLNSNDIAGLLNVSPSSVSEWRRGKKMPRVDKIETLADKFGIYKSDLIEKRPTAGIDEEPHDKREYDLLKKFRDAPPAIQDLVLKALEAEYGQADE